MMKCPLCSCASHARSSFEVSKNTKERYNQCTNVNCGHTFVSHETYVRSIVRPGAVSVVDPHPVGKKQGTLNL